MITSLPRIAIAVNDFESAMGTFSDSFGMPVVDFSETTVPGLGAHVGLCVPDGGSNIEIMSPATPGLALAESLQRFLDQRGEGLYALMLEAPDPDLEAEDLAGRGLDVLPLMKGAGGRDIHPRSTHGVLIRVYPNDSAATPGPHESAPPGLSGITTAIVATGDAAKAADVYGRGLGLAVDEPVEDVDRGVLSIRARAPKGGDIELVSVIDATRSFAARIEAFLTTTKQGLFALVLNGQDPAVTESQLADRGVPLESHGVAGVVETTIFGTRIIFDCS